MLCRSPSSSEWGSGGVTPGEIFAITNALRCVFVHFGHKIVSFGMQVLYLELSIMALHMVQLRQNPADPLTRVKISV